MYLLTQSENVHKVVSQLQFYTSVRNQIFN